MILIGTSGFSYDDWKGHFYPSDLGKSGMLAYYARQFRTVEVNSTYYSIPSPFAFRAMAGKTPPDFKFVVKAHQDMTHAEETSPDIFSAFLDSIRPLLESGKLGCVLAQYPFAFKPSDESAERLRELRDRMGEVPTVVEFRNAQWASDETFDLLRGLDLGFCSVDEPHLPGLMPPVAVATSKIAYVRFHGRNAGKWWKHEHAWQRYNYLYTEEELSDWVPKIESLAGQTEVAYMFFNNHYQGKSAENARMLARMLSLPYGDSPPEQPGLFDT